MNEFKPATLVSVIFFNGNLNLPIIAETLTCFNVEKSEKYYINKTLKIPFFGINDKIISVRYNLRSRGLRLNGNQLRNTVSIDLQIFNKNIHLKLTNTKIHITGCIDQDTLELIYHNIINHIKISNDNMLNIKNLLLINPEKKINTEKWILENFKDESNNLLMYDNPILINKINEIKDNNLLDYLYIIYISMFSYDCQIYENLILKMKILNNLILENVNENNFCFKNIPIFNKYIICNGVYTYSLNYKISLIKLTSLLIENNYNSSYHNWHRSKFCDLFIKIDNDYENSPQTDIDEDEFIDEDDSDYDDSNNKVEKIKGHRFKISSNGAIRQNSPTLKIYAYKAMIQLLTFLNKNMSKIKRD